MKKIFKFFVWSAVIFLIFFMACAFMLSLYGKKILIGQIENNLKLKTTLGNVSLSLPLRLNLQQLAIGDLVLVKKASFSLNPLSMLAGRIILDGVRLEGPIINLELRQDGSLNLPVIDRQKKAPAMILTGITIKGGRVNFVDHKISADGFRVAIDKIEAEASRVNFPLTSLNAKFNFSSAILDAKEAVLGNAHSEGWVDFINKEMDGTFDIKNLDLTYFFPYYGNLISNKKLLSARLDLNCALKAESNVLEISPNLKLADLVYAQTEPVPGEEADPELAKNALDFFKDQDGNIKLDFMIKTAMDHPRIDIEQLRRAMLNAAMKSILSQPPQSMIQKVLGNMDDLKAFGKEMGKMFKNKKNEDNQ